MEQAGIWPVKEVVATNPLDPSESFKNSFLAHTPRSSTNISQIREAAGALSHIHREHDEVIYVVEGDGEFRLGDEVRSIKPGDLVVAPAGTVHGPTANSPGFVFVSIFAPEFDPANPDRVFVE